MGSSAQQFTNTVTIAGYIKQGVRSGRISKPTEKIGFKGKMKKVDHVEGSYRGRKNQFQNNHTPSQIVNINLNFPFPTKNP
jgi:hypothetical protein